MNLYDTHLALLEETGEGRAINPSPYDTAWLARLAELDEPLGHEAITWLRENQLPDGSWGTQSLLYHHERLVCTLAAIVVLARRRDAHDQAQIRRGQLAVETAAQKLASDHAGETVGFEMIVPSLLDEARELGLVRNNLSRHLKHLVRYRDTKLAALCGHKITRNVTLAFSAEMVGASGIHLLDLGNLREANGSVGCSPAATSFFARYVQPGDTAALAYLKEYAESGAVPYVVPIDVFEHAWPLWNVALAGLFDNRSIDLCQRHLDFLQSAWTPGKGIASVACLAFTDGDATSVTYDVLKRFGRSVDIEGLLHYEEKDVFRCYALEANPSVSTNIHVLSALRQAGRDRNDPAVRKVLRFLDRARTMQLFWFDKWHVSPYYPTAHAIIACAQLHTELVADAVYWMLNTQNSDGSWGYYLPTAEETAYCLQALSIWQRTGKRVPKDKLKRAEAWLLDHMNPPYPPLWIGKSLYCPNNVVRSAILHALLIAGES
jgi:halimadienyl-diphosphate synthase